MKSKYIILSIFIYFFSACSKKTTHETIETIYINDNVSTTIKSSDIVSKHILISLSTEDNILIDNVNKIIKTESYIFLSDKYAIYQFNETGKFINILQKNGGGPDEYVSISDFLVEEDNSIWILSRGNKKLYNYAWDGTLKNEIPIPYWANNIKKVTPNNILLYIGNEIESPNKDKMLIIDLNDKKINNSFLEIDSHRATYLHVKAENHFSTALNRKDLYFYEIFNDTIFTIHNNKKIIPSFILNIRNKNIPQDFYKKSYSNIMEFFQNLFSYSYAYGCAGFIEYDSNYLISYYYDKKCFLSLVPKETSQESISFNTLKEDFYLYSYPVNFTESSFFIQEDNTIAILLEPTEIIEYGETNLSDEEIISLKETINYTDEDQNPVLFIIDFCK